MPKNSYFVNTKGNAQKTINPGKIYRLISHSISKVLCFNKYIISKSNIPKQSIRSTRTTLKISNQKQRPLTIIYKEKYTTNVKQSNFMILSFLRINPMHMPVKINPKINIKTVSISYIPYW